MSREDEHRALKSRWIRVGFIAGWAAARRALGDKTAPQRIDAALELKRNGLLKSN